MTPLPQEYLITMRTKIKQSHLIFNALYYLTSTSTDLYSKPQEQDNCLHLHFIKPRDLTCPRSTGGHVNHGMLIPSPTPLLQYSVGHYWLWQHQGHCDMLPQPHLPHEAFTISIPLAPLCITWLIHRPQRWASSAPGLDTACLATQLHMCPILICSWGQQGQNGDQVI